MDKEQIMNDWYAFGGLVVTEEYLLSVIKVLIENDVKNFYVSYLGGKGYGLGKLF